MPDITGNIITKTNYSTIARNSVFLYFRMAVSMLVSLYTSRVLLQVLGVEDYGIYNVVGGFVAMFAIVSSALSGAISRFITFELGKGDIAKLSQTFSNAVLVMIAISLLVVIIGEPVGLWFLYNKLVIPITRLDASFWVFQFALLVFIINLLATPYNACIIAHEKMDAFAYISLIEVFSKLLICFAIVHSPIDKLIFYSLLLCLVGVIVAMIYIIYCRSKFDECKSPLSYNRTITKEMFGYAGWSFIGSSGWILRNQGGTILLNLFGGPVINTANAIAVSLSAAVTNFVNCFTTAFNPQITKTYANSNYQDLNKLLVYGPKISFYLLFFIALPVILNAGFILKLWLSIVPDHSVTFVRLILIMSLIEIISVPLITVKNATGKIRNYQIVVGGLQLFAVPLAYVCLKLGLSVEWLYIAYIITSTLCLIARLLMLRSDIPEWSVLGFIKSVCWNVGKVAVIAAIIPTILHLYLDEGWIHLFVTGIASVICSLIAIYYIGLNKEERIVIVSKLKSYISRNEQPE